MDHHISPFFGILLIGGILVLAIWGLVKLRRHNIRHDLMERQKMLRSVEDQALEVQLQHNEAERARKAQKSGMVMGSVGVRNAPIVADLVARDELERRRVQVEEARRRDDDTLADTTAQDVVVGVLAAEVLGLVPPLAPDDAGTPVPESVPVPATETPTSQPPDDTQDDNSSSDSDSSE